MDKEQKAIERLRYGAEISEHHYQQPLIITYSGGKDSDILIDLALKSGINFEVLHSHTSVDAPETFYHINKRFSELELKGIKCTRKYPIYKGKRVTMWSLIPQKGIPPTRIIRYCCSVLKENGGNHRAIATGVRWAESRTRKNNRGIYEDINRNKDKRIILNNDNDEKRRLIERCELKAKVVVNPIIDWTNEEVKEYCETEKIRLNPLYDCGFNRVGCIGCPVAGKHRYEEFRRYPEYERAYIRAFNKMLEVLNQKGSEPTWQNGYDVFRWWMQEDFRQFEIADYYEE